MKKTTKTLLVLAIAITASAFTNPVKEKIEVTESTIHWLGKKVTGKHNGTINLQEGYLEMEGENMVGGKFIIDMTSITVTDLQGGMKGKLEGHLKSDDFFGVETYPTATLIITSATKSGNTYEVNGDITIKGITQPITFNLTKEGNTATTTVIIDRSKFNVRYGSGSFFDNLGDKTIYDDFQLDVTLKF
ncbi:MAG: YceI family protein [Flavobacteriaceae bacterium]|nr:YceI family protein [Flavobacteriaceae bacterium]